MRFPYLKIPAIGFPQTKHFYKPIIPIRLINPKTNKGIRIDALIDSGADATVLAATFGKEIGLDVRKGEEAKLSGLGGKAIRAYFHEIILEVGGNKVGSFVGFTYSKGVAAILGQIGFFDKFKVVFDQKKEAIEITPKKHGR